MRLKANVYYNSVKGEDIRIDLIPSIQPSYGTNYFIRMWKDVHSTLLYDMYGGQNRRRTVDEIWRKYKYNRIHK